VNFGFDLYETIKVQIETRLSYFRKLEIVYSTSWK
jgi:hypothetical protein